MGKTEETVIEMDIEELKEYLKSHPDIVIRVSTEDKENERSSD